MNKNNSERILKELSNIITAKDLSSNDLNLSLSIIEKIVQKDALSTKNKTESKRVGQVCTLYDWFGFGNAGNMELMRECINRISVGFGKGKV